MYISFDLDGLDPAFAPGTGTPCCGGFTSAEALTLLRLCRGANLVGGDVVEVLPDRILIYANDGEHALERITASGLSPMTSLVRRSSLEDVFLRLTGRSLIE